MLTIPFFMIFDNFFCIDGFSGIGPCDWEQWGSGCPEQGEDLRVTRPVCYRGQPSPGAGDKPNPVHCTYACTGITHGKVSGNSFIYTYLAWVSGSGWNFVQRKTTCHSNLTGCPVNIKYHYIYLRVYWLEFFTLKFPVDIFLSYWSLFDNFDNFDNFIILPLISFFVISRRDCWL